MRPRRRQPTRLLRPWDSPGKNNGVGCHFLLPCIKVKVKSLSRVRLFATPWTAAHQTPPSMGVSRQEYWSGLPLPSPRTISNLAQLQNLETKHRSSKGRNSDDPAWCQQHKFFCEPSVNLIMKTNSLTGESKDLSKEKTNSIRKSLFEVQLC